VYHACGILGEPWPLRKGCVSWPTRRSFCLTRADRATVSTSSRTPPTRRSARCTGTGQPIGPTIWRPCFRWNDLQEVSTDRGSRILRRGAGRAVLCAADAAYRRQAAGAGDRHRVTHRYKYEGAVAATPPPPPPPGSQSPTPHRSRRPFYQRAPGDSGLQRDQAPCQGRQRAGLRIQAVGLECKRLMATSPTSQEALPAVMMGTWGAQVVASPSPRHQTPAQHPRARHRVGWAASDRNLGGGRGRRHARVHQLLAGGR